MRITKVQDTPQYKKQKRRYEGVSPLMRRKFNVPFDKLFRLFSDRCISLTDIAGDYGVSRQLVSIIYDRYFKELLRITGMDRRIFCTLKRRKQLLEEIRDTPPKEGPLLAVWREVKRLDYSIRRIPTNYSVDYCALAHLRAFSNRIEIEGKICVVRATKKARSFKGPDRKGNRKGWTRYYQFQTIGDYTGKFSFLIAKGVGEFFIIPRKTIGNRPRIYIRTTAVDEPYNNVSPEVEWRDYKDRWDLIKKGA